MGRLLARWTLLASALCLFLGVSPLWGAPLRLSPVVRIERVDVSQPPRVRLFVAELDQNALVPSLPPPESVRLTVDGNPVVEVVPKIDTYAGAGEPLALTLVVQLSPAMEDVFAALRRGIVELASELPPGSQIGLVGYADVVVVDRPPAALAELRRTVEGLAIKADAVEVQLPDAISSALGPLTAPDAQGLSRRRVLVVISDGITASYDPTQFTKLAARALDAKVRIHAIAYPKFEDNLPASLAVLSKTSRGTPRLVRNPAEVGDALKALSAELRLMRLIDYELPAVFDGKSHDFEIELSGRPSEQAERVPVPLYDVPTQVHFLPIAAGIGGVLALLILAVVVVVVRRRRLREAEAILSEALRPAPPPAETRAPAPRAAAPLQMDKTMAGLRPFDGAPQEPRVVANIPDSDTAPVAQLPRRQRPPSFAPSPVSMGPIEPQAPSPPIAPAPANPPTPFSEMPSPTQFIRMAGAAEEGKARVLDAPPALEPGASAMPILQLGPLPPLSSSPAPRPAEERDLTERLEPIGKLGPLPPLPGTSPRGPPVVEGLPPLPGSSPLPGLGFLHRKTQVLNPLEIEQVDVCAWIVPLEGDAPTLLLKDGFRVGGPGADYTVPGAGPKDGVTLSLDPSGKWALNGQAGRHLLDDGETFRVGEGTFLFKFARRFEPDVALTQACLEVVGGLDDGERVVLEEGKPRVLGSHPSADAVLRGQGVARRHAAARLEGSACKLADLGSEARLSFQGQVQSVVVLEPGQEVQLGSVRLVFRVP